MNRQKTIAIFLLIFTGLLLFILAVSVSQLVLSEGRPVNLLEQQALGDDLQINYDLGESIVTFMQALVIFLAIFLPLAVLYMLFTKRGRRDLLIALINGMILIGIFLFLRQSMSQLELEVTLTPQYEEQAIVPTVVIEDLAEQVVFEADPPEWAIWLGSLVIAVILAGIIFFVALQIMQSREKGVALELIAEEAQHAIDNIQSGGDVRETIINCYREMLRVVHKTRGIVRGEAVTAEEFGDILEKKGLPGGPLRRLTYLFEEVRYGNHAATQKQVQLALMCLDELVAACRQEQTP